MAYRFKRAADRTLYETLRRLSVDPASELFLPDGSPRMGANLRIAYWQGRKGEPTPYATPGRPIYAAWKAGADDRVALDGLARGPTWPEWQRRRRPGVATTATAL